VNPKAGAVSVPGGRRRPNHCHCVTKSRCSKTGCDPVCHKGTGGPHNRVCSSPDGNMTGCAYSTPPCQFQAWGPHHRQTCVPSRAGPPCSPLGRGRHLQTCCCHHSGPQGAGSWSSSRHSSRTWSPGGSSSPSRGQRCRSRPCSQTCHRTDPSSSAAPCTCHPAGGLQHTTGWHEQ
jgi:hypothetical protein